MLARAKKCVKLRGPCGKYDDHHLLRSERINHAHVSRQTRVHGTGSTNITFRLSDQFYQLRNMRCVISNACRGIATARTPILPCSPALDLLASRWTLRSCWARCSQVRGDTATLHWQHEWCSYSCCASLPFMPALPYFVYKRDVTDTFLCTEDHATPPGRIRKNIIFQHRKETFAKRRSTSAPPIST